MRTSFLIFASLLAASATTVTPVEKVITLLRDLKAQVEDEGKTEAETYDKFSCFCKDNTESKSKSIHEGESKVNVLTANLEALTSQKAKLTDEISQLMKDINQYNMDLDEENSRFSAERATDEATEADLTAAVSALTRALTTLKESKSFAQVKPVLVQLAAMSPKLEKRMAAFLQQAPEIPDEQYSFHSDDIISTIEELKGEFSTNLGEHQEEMGKKKAAHELAVEGLNGQIKAATESKNEKSEQSDKCGRDIATDQGELATTDANLKDDQHFLKDLTDKCEQRAAEWDQRSKQRAGELDALRQALEILTGTVTDMDAAANKRALIQKASPSKSFVQAAKPVAIKERVSRVSFVQLEENSPNHKAVALLRESAKTLKSKALELLAQQIAANPFAKVKTLIQQLIERLLKEAEAEATQKGWCDTEMRTAEHQRDVNAQSCESISAELESFEAKKDALTLSIAQLKKEVVELNTDLTEATKDRHEEAEENRQTIKDGKAGRDAVANAIKILTEYYKNAAKAFVQVSPIDATNPGAGFDGNSQGKQTEAGGIIGMLEVIKTDFIRTVKQTQDAEEAAHRAFVEYERNTKVAITEKETMQGNEEMELEQTESNLVEGKQSLASAQKLLDESLKELTSLKPACVDTGMSYEERVQRREAEIEALKKAVQVLAPPAFLQK